LLLILSYKKASPVGKPAWQEAPTPTQASSAFNRDKRPTL